MALDKILDKIKRNISAPLVAGALAVGTLMPAYANENNEPEATEEVAEVTKHNVFQGNIVSSNIDSLFMYNNSKGGRVHIEAIGNPWQEVPGSNYSLGLRTPSLNGKLRLSGTVDVSHDVEDNYSLGATEMLEVLPADDVIIRAGGIQNTDGRIGGFGGAKFTPEHLTTEFEAWYDGTKFDTHGFIAAIIPAGNGNLFLGVGGELGEQGINSVSGWYNTGGTGIFTRTEFDIDDNTQSFKALIVPKGYSHGRGHFEFKSHIANRTEMRAVTTGFIHDGWAPFDAFSVDGEKGHVMVATYVNNSEEAFSGTSKLYIRPIPEIFLGVGGGYDQNKVDDEHNPRFVIEAYASVPDHPFEAYVKLDQNLRTGEPNVMAYFGFAGKF